MLCVQMKTSVSCTALQKTLTSSSPCPARSKMAPPAPTTKEMSALMECVRYIICMDSLCCTVKLSSWTLFFLVAEKCYVTSDLTWQYTGNWWCLYMHASSYCLYSLDIVYQRALRFVTNLKEPTHHCSLYARVGWPALSICGLHHLHDLIYKANCNLLLLYLCKFIHLKNVGSYRLHTLTYSADPLLLSVSKNGFEVCCPWGLESFADWFGSWGAGLS